MLLALPVPMAQSGLPFDQGSLLLSQASDHLQMRQHCVTDLAGHMQTQVHVNVLSTDLLYSYAPSSTGRKFKFVRHSGDLRSGFWRDAHLTGRCSIRLNSCCKSLDVM